MIVNSNERNGVNSLARALFERYIDPQLLQPFDNTATADYMARIERSRGEQLDALIHCCFRAAERFRQIQGDKLAREAALQERELPKTAKLNEVLPNPPTKKKI